MSWRVLSRKKSYLSTSVSPSVVLPEAIGPDRTMILLGIHFLEGGLTLQGLEGE